MPTAIKADIKTASCINPAPVSYKAAVKGNATKPGIKVTDPIIAATHMPIQPDESPINLFMTCGVSMANEIPMISRIERN